MGQMVYLNGELLEARAARVEASNPAFLHGVGLFETVRSYGGRPFQLERHLERMKNSAAKLNLPLAETVEQVREAIGMVLQANELAHARIRFTVTPPNPQDEQSAPTLLVAAQEVAGYPPELYRAGMTVYLCTNYRQSPHDPLAGHKTTSYFPRLLALREAQQKHCGEALWFTPDNCLAEGCISNVFLVKGDRLLTPPLDTPVLPGVTRAIVLELAGVNGLAAQELRCTVNDLLEADEVFLTNAIMEVMPVTRVERRTIADERPGPITLQLAENYRQLTEVPFSP